MERELLMVLTGWNKEEAGGVVASPKSLLWVRGEAPGFAEHRRESPGGNLQPRIRGTRDGALQAWLSLCESQGPHPHSKNWVSS